MMDAVVLPFIPRDPGPRMRNLARIESIRRRDNFKFRSFDVPQRDAFDDIEMDHADPCNMPSDSAYSAPDSDVG